jgi:hypothetical protein
VGLQVASGALDGATAWFDDLRVKTLVTTAAVDGQVLSSPRGVPVAGVTIQAEWAGGPGRQRVKAGRDGSFTLEIPLGPRVKVWTDLEGLGTAWLQLGVVPGKRPVPRRLLVSPGQEFSLAARQGDPITLRFFLAGIPEVPRKKKKDGGG